MDISLEIKNKIAEIEKNHNVEVLLAVESGSRAWGFESQDSDFDVRFIYKHDLEWYVNIFPDRDVIEYPIEGMMDYAGWDLQKAFGLLSKSNPVLYEWFNSPIVYVKNEKFADEFYKFALQYFSPKSVAYHYLSIAHNHSKIYLSKEKINLKKYFYTLRAIFSCMYVKKFMSPPPILFLKLMKYMDLDGDLIDEIDKLLKRKKSGEELDDSEPIELLNNFIIDYISNLQNSIPNFAKGNKLTTNVANYKFRELLRL